jgi:hypothetical protein
MYQVELQGDQVLLREFTRGDLTESLHVIEDDAVTHWLSFDSQNEDEARAMLDGIVIRAREQPQCHGLWAFDRLWVVPVFDYCG